jgi:glucoamylase
MPPQTVRRYLKQTNTPRCRPWRPDWRADTLPPGRVLRIDLPEAATVHWSADRWTTVTDSVTQDTGLGVHTFALPTEGLAPGTRIAFTWRWRNSGSWVGRDYIVTVE